MRGGSGLELPNVGYSCIFRKCHPRGSDKEDGLAALNEVKERTKER